jgi:hypothetical protein
MTDKLCGKCRSPIEDEVGGWWAAEPLHLSCAETLTQQGYPVEITANS